MLRKQKGAKRSVGIFSCGGIASSSVTSSGAAKHESRTAVLMGFDISHTLDRVASWLCSSSIINAVISNPIFTALLITALAVVVIMGVLHYSVRNSGWKRIARMSIYLLLVVSAVVFVHHYAVLNRTKTETMMQNSRDVFQSLGTVQGRGEHPVLPQSAMAVGGDRDGLDNIAHGSADDDEPADEIPCPCKGAPMVGAASLPSVPGHSSSAPAPSVSSRPDNVELGEGGITISDIMVPSTKSPFQARV